MDLLHHIALFARAIESASFTQVARESNLTQPTVSRQIAQLEAHVGTPLLHRGPRGLVPTEAGTALYPKAKRLLELAAEFKDGWRVDGERVAGLLRVNAPVAFGEAWIAPLLVDLGTRHPDLAVELLLTDRAVDVVEEGIDIALRFGPLPVVRLKARTLGSSPQVCLATPGYVTRRGRPEHPSQLADHACLVNSFVTPDEHWHFRCPTHGATAVEVRGPMRSNNIQVIREAVLAGRGIAIGPLWLYFDDLEAGRLVRVLEGFEPEPLPVHALMPPGGHLPARVRVLIEALEQAFRTAPALRASGSAANRPPPPPAE
jgi:DNA-binding transcriptional LysR family regulator